MICSYKYICQYNCGSGICYALSPCLAIYVCRKKACVYITVASFTIFTLATVMAPLIMNYRNGLIIFCLVKGEGTLIHLSAQKAKTPPKRGFLKSEADR